MAAPVVHFEILGSDGSKLREFYQQVFNWEIMVNNPYDYGLVSPAGEGSIGGGIGPAKEGQPPHATIYIQVDDLQAALDQVENRGGKTIVPVTEIPNAVTLAMFQDPAGNLIGLVQS